jgi:hypothetical protein
MIRDLRIPSYVSGNKLPKALRLVRLNKLNDFGYLVSVKRITARGYK